MVIASFGFVCSAAWSLANRGSKFWYESWERKLKDAESSVTGPFYEADDKAAGMGWLDGRRFSVSRVAIALSDYLAALWLMLLFSRLLTVFRPQVAAALREESAALFALGSIVFVIVMIWNTARWKGPGTEAL